MKRFNKYGAAHKNIVQFDVEKVENVDENSVVFRIYSNKDEFYLFFLPNYENKTIEVSTDINNKFSDRVLEFLINSGDVENVMKQVYNKAFNKISLPQEQAKLIPLNLPKLEIPTEQSSFTLMK